MYHYDSRINNLELIKSEKRTTDAINLEYYLYRAYLEAEQRDSYVIEVQSFFCGKRDDAVAHDISSLKYKAEELFTIISENFVTPCTLLAVLEDIL